MENTWHHPEIPKHSVWPFITRSVNKRLRRRNVSRSILFFFDFSRAWTCIHYSPAKYSVQFIPHDFPLFRVEPKNVLWRINKAETLSCVLKNILTEHERLTTVDWDFLILSAHCIIAQLSRCRTMVNLIFLWISMDINLPIYNIAFGWFKVASYHFKAEISFVVCVEGILIRYISCRQAVKWVSQNG